MTRPTELTILLGFNGTGKTTLLKTILSALATSGRKILIITPDSAEWGEYPLSELSQRDDYIYTGIKRHIFDPQTTLQRIEKFVKGIIVFDDCRCYLDAATNRSIQNLLIRRRQRMVDIFAVCHGFTKIPPTFFTYCNTFILFRTTDNISSRKQELLDYPAMVKHQEDVNRQAIKNPHYYRIIKQQ